MQTLAANVTCGLVWYVLCQAIYIIKDYVVINVSVGDGRHGIVYSQNFVLLPAQSAHIKSNNCNFV